jgi:hypothetical protein
LDSVVSPVHKLIDGGAFHNGISPARIIFGRRPFDTHTNRIQIENHQKMDVLELKTDRCIPAGSCTAAAFDAWRRSIAG